MTLETAFIPLQLDCLHREAAIKKADGWRFIQTHAVNGENGVDLYYSFMKDGLIENYRIAGVGKDDAVPSITDLFLAAFVFENEARELFGVDMRDIAIDFAGAMYAPAIDAPMTFISPEQKAAKDKAKKAAAAKAAKAAQGEGAESAPAEGQTGGFVMTPERKARLDAKMATMSPEKRAKVEAALKARAAEAAARESGAPAADPSAPEKATVSEAAVQQEAPATMFADEQLESLIGLMDASKADVVRGALNMGGAEAAEEIASTPAKKAAPVQKEAVPEDAVQHEPPATMFADEQIEALLGLMDDSKAAIVRNALNMKGGE